MKAFLRHIIRSADESRGQMAVIVITIAVVTAMIFIAFSMSDVFYNVNMAEYDRVAQGADMLIGSNFNTNTTFSLSRAESIISTLPEGTVTDVSYFYKATSVLKTDTRSKTVLIEATDMSDYLNRHPLRYADVYSVEDAASEAEYAEKISQYSPVVIGKRFAEQNDISAGDVVEIYLPQYESYTSLLVRYIAVNEGIFSSAADVNMLVDFTAVGNVGAITAAYVTFAEPGMYEEYLPFFEEAFPAVSVDEGNNMGEVMNIVKNNTLLLAVGLAFLIVTMSLILFTSYLIISRNRMSEMVVFKAAGATPAEVAGIMFGEVVFYLIIGGAVGLILGRFAMTLAANILIPAAANAVTYEVWKYVLSFLIAVAVTFIATSGPVISVSKKTVRELTSESFRFGRAHKPYTVFIALLILAGAVTAYVLTEGIALAVSAVALVAAAAFFAYAAVPHIIRFFAYLTKRNRRGGAFALSGAGITRNRAMGTVTTLVSVVVAFSFLVVEVVGLVQSAIVPFETRYRADVVVNVGRDFGDHTVSDLDAAVDSTYGVEWSGRFNYFDYYLPGSDSEEWTLYGVEDMETLYHCIMSDDEALAERWNATENPIVLSTDMMLRYGLKTGDTITVAPSDKDYANRVRTFTVVGEDTTVTEYDRVGYVKYSVIAEIRESCTYLIDVADDADANEVFVNLRSNVEKLNIPLAFALEFDEWAYAASSSLDGVSSLLSLLQTLVYLVAVIGIVNISAVTFFDRRNEFKLYRISGMSSSDYMRFSLGEGLIAGGAGVLTGFVIGYGINLLVPSLGSIIGKYLALDAFPVWLLAVAAAALALFIGCWLTIAATAKDVKISSVNERIRT